MRELVAGEYEPPLRDPEDDTPDALIDVITGEFDPGKLTPEQKVAFLALYITQTTKPGHAHESPEVMAMMRALDADPEFQAYIAQQPEMAFIPPDTTDGF